MAKYDDVFKRKVVKDYKIGEGGYGTIAQCLLVFQLFRLLKMGGTR
ncbi:hypothetical protein [Listeria seeligeri]|nr:hypothetical protein [Listeria seeligeri]